MSRHLTKTLLKTTHNSIILSLYILNNHIQYLPKLSLIVLDRRYGGSAGHSIAELCWIHKKTEIYAGFSIPSRKTFFDIVRDEKVDKSVIEYMLFNTPWNWKKEDITEQLHDELVAMSDLDTTQVMKDIFG